MPHRLVIASNNQSKIQELEKLLAPLGVMLSKLSDYSGIDPEETGTTFQENALIKARFAFDVSGHTAVADDSGLIIPGLNGKPGLYSKRYAGEDQNYPRAMETLYKELAAKGEDRSAYFYCVIALVNKLGEHFFFEGRIHGTLVWPPRGDQRFGYDPFFMPKGHDQTFGEMSPALKNRISHRAQAISKLCAYFQK